MFTIDAASFKFLLLNREIFAVKVSSWNVAADKQSCVSLCIVCVQGRHPMQVV